MELAVVAVSAGVVALAPLVAELSLLFTGRKDILKYLESGTVNQVVPQESLSKELVPYGKEFSSLSAVDGVLVAGGTSGLLMLAVPGFRWYGGATLLSSFILSRTRDNANLIAAASGGLALLATQPVAFAGAAANILGAAASATASATASAVELSTSIVGVLVTSSGAIVGYLLATNEKSKKNKK